MNWVYFATNVKDRGIMFVCTSTAYNMIIYALVC